jgi:hypothetical protein
MEKKKAKRICLMSFAFDFRHSGVAFRVAHNGHTQGCWGRWMQLANCPPSLACGGDRGIKESNPDLGARKQA